MLFNSVEYLLFLPITFVLYWLLFKNNNIRNTLLLVASYVFYGMWSPFFLSLLFVSSAISYVTALLIEKLQRRSIRLMLVLMVIFINLGALVYYKYFNFFLDSFYTLFGMRASGTWARGLNVVLPVGISFYTFQVVGYMVDVYRKKIASEKNPVTFFTFVSFFPQLVAGPIERASHLLPQFNNTRIFSYSLAVDGMRQLLWGLMKKMLLADVCAKQVDFIFLNYTEASAAQLWLGGLFFTFQIYGDFSGYSDMAIGSAKLFGIRLMDNFRLPYFSATIPEFWRRWHISLMSWLRDYIYIPLGGSRCGTFKYWRNIMIVFMVSGLWHGANWTFVVWGIYHAFLSIVFVIVFGKKVRGFQKYLSTILTFVSVLLGWVIFRSASLFDACQYVVGMFDVSHLTGFTCGRQPLIYILLFVSAEAIWRKRSFPLALVGHGILQFRVARYALYYLLFFVTLWFGGEQMQFIYFQF